MTIALQKEELISALDSGRVRFCSQSDLTPTDVYQILHANANRITDTCGKYDIDLDSLFPAPDYTKDAKDCLTPEDVAEAQQINKRMKGVQQEARYRFARSAQLARGLILRDRIRES